MDLTFNLAPSYRDLKDPTIRKNFDDMVEQKRVIDLRACRMYSGLQEGRYFLRMVLPACPHAHHALPHQPNTAASQNFPT